MEEAEEAWGWTRSMERTRVWWRRSAWCEMNREPTRV
jgi:hypothetical protein